MESQTQDRFLVEKRRYFITAMNNRKCRYKSELLQYRDDEWMSLRSLQVMKEIVDQGCTHLVYNTVIFKRKQHWRHDGDGKKLEKNHRVTSELWNTGKFSHIRDRTMAASEN